MPEKTKKKYTDNFVKEVKRIYPNHKLLLEFLDEENDEGVGMLLEWETKHPKNNISNLEIADMLSGGKSKELRARVQLILDQETNLRKLAYVQRNKINSIELLPKRKSKSDRWSLFFCKYFFKPSFLVSAL